MMLETEKFKEAVRNEDQLNIYAEFSNILNTIVDMSKEHNNLKTKEAIIEAKELCLELTNEARLVYENLNNIDKELIIASINKIEKLGKKLEMF